MAQDAKGFSQEAETIRDLLNVFKVDVNTFAGMLDRRATDGSVDDGSEEQLRSEIENLQHEWDSCFKVYKECFATSIIGAAGLLAPASILGPGCMIVSTAMC